MSVSFFHSMFLNISYQIYASVEQIRGFMTRVYAQLYDYAVIVALRKNPDTNVYEPYVKYKFPPQVSTVLTLS